MKKKNLFSVCLIAFLFLSSIYFVPPMIRGDIRALAVLSGSMNPMMNVGDLVVFSKVNPEEVEPGDIIVFKDPHERKNVLITHRVLEFDEEGGGFKTKGDACEDPDIFVVKPEDVVGKPVFLVPFAGYFFGPKGSKSPLIWLFLVILPAGLIIAGEIQNIFTSPSEARKKEKEKRREERKKRIKVDYKKLLPLYLILSIPFFIISAPSLAMSDNVEVDMNIEKQEIKNEGLTPCVIVFDPCEKIPYRVLSKGNATEIEIRAETESETSTSISSAPHIMPVFWIVQLASMNPFLPAVVTSLIPPLVISLILYPIWIKEIRKSRRRRRKRR